MLKNLLAAALVFAGLASGAALKQSSIQALPEAQAATRGERAQALKDELDRLRRKQYALIWDQAFRGLARSRTVAASPTALPEPRSAESAPLSPLESGPEAEEARLLQARIAELEAELSETAASEKTALSDAAMAAKVASIRSRFAEALKNGDGPAALALMAELAALDERAFPALVQLWGEIREAGWPGVDRRERMAWATPDVLRWAMLGEGLGDDNLSRRFLREAIEQLRDIEPDFARQAATYLAFLDKAAPRNFNEKQLRKLGRRVRRVDPFRNALRQLGRVDDPAAAARLAALANQANLPRDMRLQAIDGLRRQSSAAADDALRLALNDGDPRVRRAAELALGRRNPAATGYFVTSRRGDGQASALGIAPGAIIVSFDGKPVRRGRDLDRYRRRAKSPTVTMQVFENGQLRQVQVDPRQRVGIDGDFVRKRGP